MLNVYHTLHYSLYFGSGMKKGLGESYSKWKAGKRWPMSERQLTIIQSFVKIYISSVKRHQSQDTNHKTPIAWHLSHDTCRKTPVKTPVTRLQLQDTSRDPAVPQVLGHLHSDRKRPAWPHASMLGTCHLYRDYHLLGHFTVPYPQCHLYSYHGQHNPIQVQVTLTLTNLNQDAQ